MAKSIPLDLYLKFVKFMNLEFVRQSGSHMMYNKTGLTRCVTIPNHGQKKGVSMIVIASNNKTLGITNEEFTNIIDSLTNKKNKKSK